VGGGDAEEGIGGGIHWHMNIDNRIEYISTDAERQVIPWVKFTNRAGKVTEFTVDGTTPADLAKGEHRVMDCLDCHNRPAHTFEPSAERAVDNAIARGEIPRSLPFVRRESVAALKTVYASKDAAMTGIAAKFRELYPPRAGDASAAMFRTIEAVQGLYATNIFPAMKVAWGTYPNNLGHVAFQGCFRCHDDNHKTTSGKTIAQGCESCHSLPS
jgi:cytochrome c2